MQTTRFLDEYPDWQQISVANTAVAARKVLEDRDKKQAAVIFLYAAPTRQKFTGLRFLRRISTT